MAQRPRSGREGVALLMVIFIIVGVAIVAAPLAYSMLAQEHEGVTLVGSAKGLSGAIGARNEAIYELYSACADSDPTPRTDTATEFVPSAMGPGPSNLKLAMNTIEDLVGERSSWGASVTDLQSLVNLNTLTPLLCENLLGRRVPALYGYRISGDEGVYRLFRTVYEARSTGVSSSEMDVLARLATVWSGPNIYGNWFTHPVPASIDENRTIRVSVPGVGDMLAPGLVIRILTGTPPDYEAHYVRIVSLTDSGDHLTMQTSPALEPADECLLSVEVPRPVNVNTASPEVLKALFKGISMDGGSPLSDQDAETLTRAIISARAARPIEGRIEMYRLITDTFGPGSEKSAALMKAVSFPAPALYRLDGYTAPLCYDSDDIFRIESFAVAGTRSSLDTARENLVSIVSVTPPREVSWTFYTQYDWQRLLDCGFGPWQMTGPRTCFVIPPDGYVFDVSPSVDEGYVTLATERTFRDRWTTFLAHYDTGTGNDVFDASWAEGEKEAYADGLEVTEDPDTSSLSLYGVNFASGGNLYYECQDNVPWRTGQGVLQMEIPTEIDFWVHLADDWDPSVEQVLFEFGESTEYENRVRIWWKPPDSLVLTICDAGIQSDRFHYRVRLPDPEGYIEWTPGGNYHVRVVFMKTWVGYAALFIDGKKMDGLFCNDAGLESQGVVQPLVNGVSSRLGDYEWTLPPQDWGVIAGDGRGDAQRITVDGTLYPGNAKLTRRLGSTAPGDGFVTTVLVLDPNSSSIPPNATKITVSDVSGFPDEGVLLYRSGNTVEYIYYRGKDESSTPQAFLSCVRGYDFTFGGNVVGSHGHILPNGARLQLISMAVDDNSLYPDAGYLYIRETSEIISYMGKAMVGGEPCFILNPLYSRGGAYGRSDPSVPIPQGALCLQVFYHAERGSINTGDEVTVIDNEQTKELARVAYASGHWAAFEAPVANTYYITANGMPRYSRILKFPSGELPTVRPDRFAVGSDRFGDNSFMGSIDELKIIRKVPDDSESPLYQPYDLWYGRYSDEAADEHLVLANIYFSIGEESPPPLMKGKCYASLELDSLGGGFNEAVYMVPTDDNPDTPPVTSVTLQKGTNTFSSSIRVSSTEGFPQKGYILVQGTYTARYTDPFSGRTSPRSVGYHVVFYYDALTADSFTGLQVFRTIDDSTGDSTTINVFDTDTSDLKVALVSTEVRFLKRGGLWSQETSGQDPQGRGDFPEGYPMMCLRYPFGVPIVEPVGADPGPIEFEFMPFDIREADFEFGDKDDNDLEVVGCSLSPDAEENTTWDMDFRGCFGTTPASHNDHTVATLLDVRFRDRSAPLSDSPHLRYLALQTYRPGMRIRAIGWEEDEDRQPELTGIRILMRVDNCAEWDSDPGGDLFSLREFSSPPQDRVEISCSSDTSSWDYFPANFVEFRIFFEWKDGAYLSNDWKGCARLKAFRMFYERPVQILSSRRNAY